MGPDERAIRQLRARWIEAVNAGDLERLLGWMADDAVFLTPGRAARGREEFSAGFLAGLRQGRIRCVSEVKEVVVVGEVGYSWSRDTVSVTPSDGTEAIQFACDALTVWRKRADGEWVLARDACTLVPAARKGRED
jgi:uncharacterized protein (TIGR02246 family)